jgi:flavin reductase (DIM6/NTAB) family NADH-FMN oxidoreductase RutF
MKSMEDYFKVVDSKQLTNNFFVELDNNWALLTAGKKSYFNVMTVSWGTLGILWNMPVAIVFCRPQRHTFGYINNANAYTLSFLYPEDKNILKFCGSHSGKDTDKIKATGLEPLITKNGNMGYKQSRLTFECEKIYTGNIEEKNFNGFSLIQSIYPTKDFHRFYIGKITGCYIKEHE